VKAVHVPFTALVAISPDVLAVHPSNPAKDMREFINTAKEKSFTYDGVEIVGRESLVLGGGFVDGRSK
jgi:hypothetical protein